jgi:hypothetical protein
MIDPRTGTLVGVSLDGQKAKSVFQSVNHCQIQAMGLCPENKDTVVELGGELYDWIAEASLSEDEFHLPDVSFVKIKKSLLLSLRIHHFSTFITNEHKTYTIRQLNP